MKLRRRRPTSHAVPTETVGGIEMKAKVISCGILAALLGTAAFAQHTRLSNGGTVPAARMPNAVTGTPSTPSANIGHSGVAPNANVSPNANLGHDGVAPNAQAGTTSVKKPRKAKSAKPMPDVREFPNRTAVSF